MPDHPDTQPQARRSIALAVGLEALVGLVLVVLAAIHLGQYIEAMSTHGMWNDELVSIEQFSSQGLRTTLTTYPIPNNHVFFNALAAITPTSDRFNPISARLWSFLALTLLLVASTWAWAGSRRLLEAGLFAHAALTTKDALQLGLQARGYGLLMLFATLTAICVWRMERRPELWSSVVFLGTITLLGVWTSPTYLLFGAPLMVLIALRHRTRAAWGVGVATAVAIAAAYAPIAQDVYNSSFSYGEQWGYNNATLDTTANMLQDYWLSSAVLTVPTSPLITALAFGLLAGVASMATRTAEQRATRLTVAACVIFLGTCLALGTPPERAVSFISLPLSFCVVLLVSSALPTNTRTIARAVLAVAFGAILIPADILLVKNMTFTPKESWRGVAQYIDHVLPDNASVAVPFRGHQLRYFVHNHTAWTSEADASLIAAGQQVALLNRYDKAVDSHDIPPNDTTVSIVFPQRRAGHQTLLLGPTHGAAIAHLDVVEVFGNTTPRDVSPLLDRHFGTSFHATIGADNPGRTVTLRITVPADCTPKSYLLVLGEGSGVKRVEAACTLGDGTVIVIPEELVFMRDTSVAISLDVDPIQSGTTAVESVEIAIRVVRKSGMRELTLNEVWGYERVR